MGRETTYSRTMKVPIAMKRPRNASHASTYGFTLIEIMIVVAIIALLAAMAIPGLLRARKRSQGVAILTDLRLIDAALDQYAIENNLTANTAVPAAAWLNYIKPGSRLYVTQSDLFGNPYGAQAVAVLPAVPSQSWDTLSDVCNSSFWAPYSRGN
jgi:prepilin-type N-terminal cleavage/methylation domain-containing protein